MISLTEPYAKDDEFEIQLGNTAISKTDSFSFTIAYSSSNSSGGARFSCSNFADCDEDKDGWLYDYNEGDDVYFCNCGTFYDNSMMVAIPVGNEPTRLFVYLDYHQDPFLTSLIYRTVLTFGLAAGVVFGRKTENKFFTWTILSLGIPLMLLGPFYLCSPRYSPVNTTVGTNERVHGDPFDAYTVTTVRLYMYVDTWGPLVYMHIPV